ncbi:hypothetical protein BKA70DRAFT_333704 [Coprinopsis sp. MPI-PUGE-AT-0042]|nr:hypothetical protein BKA70DRAFT_333704 [Coprinopsis sp. MPI-PUGE-AT-0042]
MSEKKHEKSGDNVKGRDIITDDAHLNEDPEALHQFLLKQVETNKPILRLRIDGSEVTNHTGVTADHQNFLFWIEIPLPPSIASHPIHWSLADSEPAYRGRSTREFIKEGGKKEYTGGTVDGNYIKQRDARRARGYPPWLMDTPNAPTSFGDAPVAGASAEEVAAWVERRAAAERGAWKSSMNLKQWVEEYVSSTRSKEFIFQQETYGWDLEKLKAIIEKTIREKGGFSSAGTIEITHSHIGGRIQVRPASTMSKLVSKLGGAGTWKTCGVAYPLVGYVDARFDDQDTVKTPAGLKKRVGMTEEEWFRKHEQTIVDAVKKELDSTDPLVLPLEA